MDIYFVKVLMSTSVFLIERKKETNKKKKKKTSAGLQPAHDPKLRRLYPKESVLRPAGQIGFTPVNGQ